MDTTVNQSAPVGTLQATKRVWLIPVIEPVYYWLEIWYPFGQYSILYPFAHGTGMYTTENQPCVDHVCVMA